MNYLLSHYVQAGICVTICWMIFWKKKKFIVSNVLSKNKSQFAFTNFDGFSFQIFFTSSFNTTVQCSDLLGDIDSFELRTECMNWGKSNFSHLFLDLRDICFRNGIIYTMFVKCVYFFFFFHGFLEFIHTQNG